ncbi:MAG: STAS domain-containing protein [Solirubrobacteraceae bacterium]
MPEPVRPEGFSVTRATHDGGVVVSLHGEFDIAGIERVEAATAELPPGTQLVLDLGDLQFIDSSGLRTLMNLDLRSRGEGWSLAFSEPQPAVRRLLRLCGFEHRVPLTPG